MEKHEKVAYYQYGITANPTALAVMSTDRPRPLSASEEKLVYMAAFGHSDVSYLSLDEQVLASKIEEWLVAKGWYLHRKHSYASKKTEIYDNYQCWIHPDGFLLSLSLYNPNLKGKNSYSISNLNDFLNEEYVHIGKKKDFSNVSENVVESYDLYYPASKTGTEEIEKMLEEFLGLIRSNPFEDKKESRIGIISHDGSEFYVKKFSLEGKVPKFIHTDEHYGEGFTEFHDKMLTRIKEESKGLILFHGDPGTGKTQYIRMLLDMLTRSNKSILYAPPSLSSQLTEPQMIEFISDWVMDEENDCILLIEDAEPLLEVRNGQDGRSTGISNLLNMTDGLLNDMLGLMVICTFNTDIAKIDSALLRPQRLIARKEFNKLSFDQGERLAEALGIANPLDVDQYPASLADFYASKKETSVLIHSVKEERKIGFR